MGLSEAILEAALKRAHGRRLVRVRVRVGGHPVDPDVINQGFQLAAVGTPAADAVVDVINEPLIAECGRCGYREKIDHPMDGVVCRGCNSVDVQVLGEDNVVLESIEVVA